MGEQREERNLPIKHRPQRWEDFAGNEAMVASLRSVLERDTGQPHCVMFQGPSGCGKTTLARMVAKVLGCVGRNLFEYNISDMRGIDTAREIIAACAFAPIQGSRVKVYVLNEMHKATNEFQNAMLDILEHPPSHVYFIICTTEPEKILPTIRGQRATVFNVAPLQKAKMISFLKSIVDKEGADHFSEDVYAQIAMVSEGSPRKALTILDQVIDIENEKDALDAIASAGVGEADVKEIIDYLMGPGKKDWKAMSKMVRGLDLSGDKPERVRNAICRYFGTVFLNRGDKRSHEIMTLFMEPFFYSGRERFIDAVFIACQE